MWSCLLCVCCVVRLLWSFFSLTHSSIAAIYTLSLHDALPICLGVRDLTGIWELVLAPETLSEVLALDSGGTMRFPDDLRSEEHTSELQSHHDLVCRLLLEKKKLI